MYSGEYLIENGFYIFDLIAQYNSNSSNKIQLKIIGNKEINYKIIMENIHEEQLLENVEFLDHLPQNQLYKEIVKEMLGSDDDDGSDGSSDSSDESSSDEETAKKTQTIEDLNSFSLLTCV